MSQNPISSVEEIVGSDSSIGPRSAGKVKQSARYEYNFNVHGGAIATFLLRGPILPDNAVITNSYVDVIVIPTSDGSATIGLGFLTTTDINNEDAISGTPWSATGLADTDAPEPGTESGYIKLTAPLALQVTVATAALTAGRFFVVIEWDLTD